LQEDGTGKNRVLSAIESAWAARGLTKDAVLIEVARRQGIHEAFRLLHRGGPEIEKAGQDSFLKVLAALGRDLTMNDAIFLLQPHGWTGRVDSTGKLVWQHGRPFGDDPDSVVSAIESAWAAKGLTKDAVVNELTRRNDEYQARYAKDVKEAQAKMPKPPVTNWWFGSTESDSERRKKEIDRSARERAANRGDGR